MTVLVSPPLGGSTARRAGRGASSLGEYRNSPRPPHPSASGCHLRQPPVGRLPPPPRGEETSHIFTSVATQRDRSPRRDRALHTPNHSDEEPKLAIQFSASDAGKAIQSTNERFRGFSSGRTTACSGSWVQVRRPSLGGRVPIVPAYGLGRLLSLMSALSPLLPFPGRSTPSLASSFEQYQPSPLRSRSIPFALVGFRVR